MAETRVEQARPEPREKREEYHDVKEMPPTIADAAPAVTVAAELIDEPWLGHRAMVLHDVFSEAECSRAIAYFDSFGVTQKCHDRTDYRNNYRVVAQSETVAKAIFDRIRPFLADEEVVSDATASWYMNQGAGMYGVWRPAYLNPCFRLCKYDPDGHFAPHYDTDFQVDANTRSLKTFMIYLNDDYEAGATNFLEAHNLHFDDAAQRFKAPASAVRAALKARRGDALIFDHNILHEGATVAAGTKYIMRCEVMYARDAVDRSTLSDDERAALDREERALALLREAQLLEADRRELEAVELYRRAFKLAPHLDR